MATISQILEETKQYIATKEASFTGGFKRAQAMNGIEDMPGSEHDSKVPAEYEKPDPEVDDGSVAPEGAFSNIEGAGKEDITMKHVLEVDEPADTPDEEPLITDEADAEPKTAAAQMANALLSRIRQFQNTKRAANQQFQLQLNDSMLDKLASQIVSELKADQKPAEKPAEKKAEEQKPAEKKAEAQKPAEQSAEKPAEKPAEKKAEEQKPAEKKAEENKSSAKQIAQQLITKVMAEKKAAAEQRGAEDALRDLLNSAYAQGARDTFQKLAQLAADPSAVVEQPGVDGQAALAAMGGAPASAPTPEAAPAADANLSVPDEMKGEDVSAEDVVEALSSAVESGEIDPETAQAVLSELAAAEGAAEGAADEAPSAEDKEAAEKFASAIKEAADEIEAAENEAANSANLEEAPPTVEEIQQAVAELVDEGQIDPESGAAILEQVGAEAPVESDDKEASVKKAAETIKAIAKNYRDSRDAKAEFNKAIKEAADEIDAAEKPADQAPAVADAVEASGDEVTPEDLVQGIAELVQSGEVSPEDAEDALHAILGDAE